MKKRIKFIINPIAGTIRKKRIPQKVEEYLDQSKYDYDIEETQYAGHAIEIAKTAVKDKYDVVVAVGGDGSINEISQSLVHTNTTLGIIPAGSGNGFAMHMGIGRNIKNAFKILNKGQITTVDTGLANDRFFVNLTGLGIDGMIAYQLKEMSNKGFKAYFKATFQHILTYPFQKYSIQLDDKPPVTHMGFLLEVANGPMFGYNFNIVPQASPTDGFLDILLVKKAPKVLYVGSLVRLMLRRLDSSKYVETYRVKKMTVKVEKPMMMHIDGEGFMQSKEIIFQIQEQSLKVIC